MPLRLYQEQNIEINEEIIHDGAKLMMIGEMIVDSKSKEAVRAIWLIKV